MTTTPPPNTPLWETGRWTPLPPVAEPLAADVCVVGLGGSGLTAVHELLDRGARVIGIDAGIVAGGAAGRNGGLALAGLAPFYHRAVEALGHDRALAFYRATMEEQARMRSATPEHVRVTDSLRIAVDAEEGEDCIAQFEAMQADGLPVELYDGGEGRGLLFPGDMSFNPLARCRSLARQALERGAQLFEGSAATDIAGETVVANGHPIRCGAAVVAVDGRLDLVLPELAGRVRTARLQMLGTEPATDAVFPRPMYLRDGYEYVQQLENGAFALGGFRDMFEADEWTHDATPTNEIQELLESFLRDCVRTKARITHRWAASVGYVEGTLPVMEEVRSGVWAIGGYCGTGNLVGALAGRAAAAAALGQSCELLGLFRGE
ncbi:FAD dependent oxidoreductase [Planctomycetes bacterium Poly30]|uniref:FAD dependent oxidoreductase n=1 Tax=Saltatorellus ferox TaxID=2528018 RepID=A0A518F0I7_9BACT|nr:FAD dependent oxidoreductase [Planctomycetes bacterium Poly30]